MASAVRSAAREEGVELEDAELAERGSLHLGDQRRQVQVRPCRPRVLDQVGEQDVLAAGERVGLRCPTIRPSKPADEALDLVASVSASSAQSGARGASRQVDGTPAVDPGV
jgi:hypothetical protein